MLAGLQQLVVGSSLNGGAVGDWQVFTEITRLSILRGFLGHDSVFHDDIKRIEFGSHAFLTLNCRIEHVVVQILLVVARGLLSVGRVLVVLLSVHVEVQTVCKAVRSDVCSSLGPSARFELAATCPI